MPQNAPHRDLAYASVHGAWTAGELYAIPSHSTMGVHAVDLPTMRLRRGARVHDWLAAAPGLGHCYSRRDLPSLFHEPPIECVLAASTLIESLAAGCAGYVICVPFTRAHGANA
jgi:hypothetical protein